MSHSISRLAGGELRREFARILPRLVRQGAALEPRDAGGFALVCGRTRAKAKADVAPAVVTALVAAGLARADGGRITAAPEAQSWLARLQAGEDGFHQQHRERAESVLDWLLRRGRIAGWQRDAGERLACDHAIAASHGRITVDWQRVTADAASGPSQAGPVAERVLAARLRVRRALAAAGPGLDAVLIAVCCEGLRLEEVERRHGWPQRAAKVVLDLALLRLGTHYGLAPRSAPAAITAWMAPEATGGEQAHQGR